MRPLKVLHRVVAAQHQIVLRCHGGHGTPLDHDSVGFFLYKMRQFVIGHGAQKSQQLFVGTVVLRMKSGDGRRHKGHFGTADRTHEHHFRGKISFRVECRVLGEGQLLMVTNLQANVNVLTLEGCSRGVFTDL